MKQFRHILATSLLVGALGLSGCDAMTEGYEAGKTTVEFTQFSQSVFEELKQLESSLAQVEDIKEIQRIQREIIDKLKAQQQTLAQEDNSELLILMSQLTVDNVVTMMEYNLNLVEQMAPMRMSIGERFNALMTEQGYQQHKDKLLALQQSISQMEGTIDADIANIANRVEQSELHDGLKTLLSSTLQGFNGSFKVNFLEGLTDLPALVEQELRWVDYIFENKGQIQIDENDQLIFETQEALDAYNQYFAI